MKQMKKEQQRRRHGGPPPGSGSRLAGASKTLASGATDKPTIGDIEHILRESFKFTKYEGEPAPGEEHFRSTTWMNDHNDRIYVLMPAGKDHESLNKIKNYLAGIFAESRDDLLSRSTGNVLRAECANISIHFYAGAKKPADKIGEFITNADEVVSENDLIKEDSERVLHEEVEFMRKFVPALQEAKKALSKLQAALQPEV